MYFPAIPWKHSKPSHVSVLVGFALLLPETNEESARVALSKIQDGLLKEMRLDNWPITFSIGVLTCRAAPHTTEELVGMADELMYSVKRESKNAIKYFTYAG